MTFICEKSVLCEAISNVSKATTTKSAISALEGIKLKLTANTLELTGYDLDLGIRTSIPVKSNDSGKWIINARLFGEIARKMPSGEITTEIDEALNVKITGNQTEYSISSIPADEYPDLPEYSNESRITIKQSSLKSMIQQTIYAVAINDNKPILTGELFDISADGNFNLVAIDGFRMAVRTEKTNISKANKFVVPSKALNEVSRLLKDDDEKQCDIYTTGRHIVFDMNGYLVFSRLLEGEFHNYTASIPQEHSTSAEIGVKEMLDCLERCSLLINEKNKAPVRCNFTQDKLEIKCGTTIGRISEEITCKTEGEGFEIGLNNRFFYEALRATECDKVLLQMDGPKKPVKIMPSEGQDFIFLLMPVQIRD